MKKLFLFLCGALLSLGLSAAETYDVVINKANIDITADNNLDFTDQLPAGTFLKAGDVINFTLKGFFGAPATVQINALAANDFNADGEGKYWYQLSDWIGATAPQAVLGEEYSYTQKIDIVKDALTNTKYIVQIAFGLGLKDKQKYGTTFKIRPTLKELEADAKTYTIEVPTILFGPDSPTGATNFKAEVPFTTEAAMAEDDILEVTFNGKFNKAINGLVFMVFDKDGNTILPWTQQTTFQASADETINTTLQLTIPTTCPTTDAKLAVFIEGYTEGVEYKFLKDGDVEHDPVEVAKKDYTEVTMSYNQYATPANYQFIDASIAENVQVGDYVTFSVTGKASAAFTKMIAYVRNATTYSAVSSQVVVAENVAADGTVSYSGTIEITAAVEGACDLVFEITDEATEGTSIYIGEGEPYIPVELASKTYTNVTMTLNEWDGGSNYQYVEEITAPAAGFQATDYVTFSINGVASEAIEGLQVYLMDDNYGAVSDYKIVQENIAKDGTVDVEGKIELIKATDVCKFVIVTTDAKKEGVASITIGEAGSQDAVEEVSAVSFENGVVYSAGKIEVYNVAGQIEATASQQFDTKSLNSGVYFITTPEGTIKIQK